MNTLRTPGDCAAGYAAPDAPAGGGLWVWGTRQYGGTGMGTVGMGVPGMGTGY